MSAETKAKQGARRAVVVADCFITTEESDAR